MKQLIWALVVAGASLGMAQKIGNCELSGTKGQFPLKPAVAGQLTVQVNLPAPGWWNGDSPDTIKDGFEYCMAANIAYRAGLDKVKVQNVAWDALVAGQTKAFDLALSQISITPERKKVVDFSVPYFSSDIGVMVKKGAKVDASTIKNLRVGVQGGTTAEPFAKNTLKVKTLRVFPDTPGMFTALLAGQVDVAMIDTSIVLAQAKASAGKLEVVGQYKSDDIYGALYPKNSPNKATLDKIIQSMIDDGTLKKLSQKYLASAWGADPLAIPYWKP